MADNLVILSTGDQHGRIYKIYNSKGDFLKEIDLLNLKLIFDFYRRGKTFLKESFSPCTPFQRTELGNLLNVKCKIKNYFFTFIAFTVRNLYSLL